MEIAVPELVAIKFLQSGLTSSPGKYQEEPSCQRAIE